MDWEKEKQEALDAGYAAMDALEEARDYLDSARKWGIVDTLSNKGFIFGMIKHSKMRDAEACIQNAQNALVRFNNELSDLDLSGINVDTHDLLGIADIFFDGIVADLFMQSRIKDAQYQVDRAIDEIQRILDRIEDAY